MSPISAIPMLAAAAVASIAVLTDLRSRRIPNVLTGAALLVGLSGNILLGLIAYGTPGALAGGLSALGGAVLGFGLLMPLYLTKVGGGGHAIGAGDVKLLASLGAILGPQLLISVAIYAAIAGGLQSFVLLLRHRPLGLVVYQVLVARVVPGLGGLKAPYALPIAAGVFLSMALPPVLKV
jgi:prepilin peptidase CpaA